MIQTTCPSCSAPLSFRASHSLLSVCTFCQSTVIRTDLDLSVLGKMSEVREDHSPLQVGASGTFQGTPFRVVGRLQARFDGGLWNEWYCMFGDGREGWIGESNGRLTVLFEEAIVEGVPSYDDLKLNAQLRVASGTYEVTERRLARVVGAQGELPFAVLGGYVLPFADLTSAQGRFGTLDYSDEARPALYTGPFVPLRDLAMKGLRTIEGFAKGATGLDGDLLDLPTESFSCPNCAAPLKVSVPGQAQRFGCSSCGSLLGVDDNRVALIERWREAVMEPPVPLGSRGELDGVTWEVLGVIKKAVVDVYAEYPWLEYLLFNPYEGYRWLVESNGHYSFLEPCAGVPAKVGTSGRRYRGTEFREFQTGEAVVRHVLGELYWQVKLGDIVQTADYIAPPLLLSREGDGSEQTWSCGSYKPAQQIWEAFKLGGATPQPEGVGANQPFDPEGRYKGFNTTFIVLAVALLLGLVGHLATARNEVLGTLTGKIEQSTTDATVWSEPFELRDRPGTLEVNSRATLNNQWLYLDMALVEEQTGQVVQLSHGLELWTGPGWAEGDLSRTSVVGPIEPGRWVLRVAPEWDKATTTFIAPLSWSVTLRWDVQRYFPFFMAFLLIGLGPLWSNLARMRFEAKRWEET